jgi:Tol biopolymer transport system component
VVTRAPGTAFPTNTPTITPTPTETPLPTATLPPISDYGIFIVTGAEGQIATFYRVAGDGSSQQRLFDNLFEADVLPNTRQIAFTRSAEGASDDENAPTGQQAQAFITTIDDPANADQVSRIPNGNIEDVALSPDGSQMVYVSTQDGDAELVLVNLQTGIARQLTNNTVSDTDPDWSPDGTTLLFTSDQTSVGRHDIYRLNLADESVSLVLDTNGIATNPRWSPDMTQIVYADARANDSNVYVVTADGSRTRQLSNRSGALFITPNWTPDGRYVVYVAQVNEGADQIVFVTPGGRDEQVITFSDTPDILQVIVR